MLICTPWKRIILVCVCGWYQIRWNERKYWFDVERIEQTSWFGRTNIIPWSCVLEMHSKAMRNKLKYCGQLQNHVRIQNFRRSNEQITMLGKTEYLFVVLRHGRPCQEMCGTLLRVGPQDDSAAVESINPMPWRPSLQRRRNDIRWRIVESLLSNRSEMFVFGTYW